MHRLLTLALLSSFLLAEGCDQLRVAVQNDTDDVLSIQFAFREGSECSTYPAIEVRPGQRIASRCVVPDIEAVRVNQGSKYCEISRKKLSLFYDENRLGEPYPIRAC